MGFPRRMEGGAGRANLTERSPLPVPEVRPVARRQETTLKAQRKTPRRKQVLTICQNLPAEEWRVEPEQFEGCLLDPRVKTLVIRSDEDPWDETEYGEEADADGGE